MPRTRTSRPASTALTTATTMALTSALLLGGCTTDDGERSATATDGLWDATAVHSIEVEVDDDAVAATIGTYLDSGEKEWISGDVTIDGETFSDVGLKLKGNSSLKQISTDTPAQDLPWRIRLDKFVDGQELDGWTDLVVRSSTSRTALNEFVALDLLEDADLASEQAIATRFSVNGGDETLRLTLQNLDDTWVEENFAGTEGTLYKADAEGDWSWRGEDGDYSTAFEVEAGEEDYAPLIALLDLVNNGTDEEVAQRLPELLDVESFARYLAFEELVDNFDDIDGPGNNSYLYVDSETGVATGVAWDHNLAFGASPAAGGAQGAGGAGSVRGGGEVPTDLPTDMPGGFPTDMPTDLPTEMPSDMPAGMPTDGPVGPGGDSAPDRPSGEGGAPGGAGAGGADTGGADTGGAAAGGDNPLVQRFLANADFTALYEQARTDLQADLYDSGVLEETVTRWQQVLEQGASDLVDSGTIASEAEQISAYAD
ncbi:CotH kinase family protein [Cellulomonas soli]|uniref:Spore coat protein CotH n=1 Tax=Cellulomonas soli TaxID=931535 RepID=A0A512PAS8_9CELL|nr:CotH kinase family protein [Cellulomonas soli]NYI57414.1 spore coat protein CotH [Cellulomonas soli]GEP68305.1 hypothetical protein CSO01_10200 [Cellulomonas soli]